jgi:hypothetical protein
MTFHPDGSYAYGTLRFDQTASLQSCRFGAATVTKEPGEGEVLTIAAASVIHQLRFLDGAWHYRTVPS